MSAAPRDEYARRLEAAREARARCERRAGRVSNLRLAVFAAGLVAAGLAFGSRALAPGWVAVPALGFTALVVVHDRLLRAGGRATRVVALYERGLARLDDRWPGGGEAGEGFAAADHPYASDLDLFGAGSLFERLCGARTRAGEAALAAWLLEPAEPARIRARQAALAELRGDLGLREDLAALGDAPRAGLHPDALRRWGEAPSELASPALGLAAALLPAVSVAALLAAWLAGAPAWVPALALLAQLGLAARLRGRVRRVLAGLELPVHEIELLAELVARIEAASFAAPLLAELRAALETGGVAPSRRIRALRTRVDLLDARRNQLFAPFAALLLWTTQLACCLERWRATCGDGLARWTGIVGELEALASLAAFAYENPELPFPEIVEGDARFEARGVAHPLLPRERRVANDLSLGGELRVLVVSGSNMSGKSTLLRTVGANAVLAFAGAPVCAESLRISPMRIGAAIRVHDSLLEGTSRFYAEIRRLRRIVELAEAGAALFLLDEILHGTNSHDRGIGAEAVVRALLGRGAVGLVTTHDLALARIADALEPRGRNVHFEDRLVDGKMVFDYRLRPGTVERSNALALMRAVGLEV